MIFVNGLSGKTLTTKIRAFTLCLTLVITAKAFSIPPPNFPWSIGGYIGFENTQDMFENDGHTAMGRFSINRSLFYWGRTSVGVEAGIQSGNQMRLDITKANLDILGGVMITGTLKPMVDILVSARTLLPKLPMAFLIKAGINYRALQMDRIEVNDLEQIAPELQIGLEYNVTPHLSFAAYFQKIFDNSLNFNMFPQTERATIGSIPATSSLFFGMTLYF